jgi:hypothetical protein
MRLLGGGELNLALMKDLVQVRLFYICPVSLPIHSILRVDLARPNLMIVRIGRRKVCMPSICCSEREAQGRGCQTEPKG